MGKIFISYSFKPWGDREIIMKEIISAVKNAVVTCGWEVCDPMAEIDVENEGIKRKVELSMRQSDAIIAEGTLLMPNIMYECGFMRSQNKAFLYLIDKDAYNSVEYDNYLKIIGISRNNKVASDFGDIEYFEYEGSKIKDPDYLTDLRSRITTTIRTKFKPHMTIGRVMLNNSFNSLNGKLSRMIQVNLKNDANTTEQPFLAFLSGWVNQLSNELLEKDNIFRLDIDYYERCLSKFTETSRKDIFAIADLTDMAEPFWFMNPEPKNTMVAERIFLLDIIWLFNSVEISKYFKVFQTQARDYAIRVGLKNISTIIPSHNYFENATHGMNCIIIRPYMVGRYVKTSQRPVNKDRILLQFVIDEYESSRHYQDYQKLQNNSIEFEKDSWGDYNKMVENIFKNYKIGKWNKTWNVQANNRDDTYFDWYEGHIRSWIKDYDDLIKTCYNTIVYLKSKLNKRRVKLLEMGFGSGTLSNFILQDKEIDYYGIDPALRKWENILKYKFGSRWSAIKDKFIDGKAWHSIPQEILTAAPYNLICGSLVLHDFYEDEVSAKKAFTSMLKFIEDNKMLSVDGSIVFLDIFLGERTTNKQSLISSWEKYMKEVGKLDAVDIENFKSGNPEMYSNLSEDDITEIALRFGYNTTFTYEPRTNNPFKVLSLEKIKQ